MMSRGLSLALALILAASGFAASPAARACAFDDEPDPDFNIDTLNNYYPGGYAVFVRVGDARRENTLGHLIAVDASKDEMKDKLFALAGAFERQLRAAAIARAPDGTPPAFSLLLLDSMMWVHFPERLATEAAEIHAPQPSPGDLIVIAGEDAIVAVASGRFDLTELEKRGWLQYFGSGPAIARFRHTFARVGATAAPDTLTRAQGAKLR